MVSNLVANRDLCIVNELIREIRGWIRVGGIMNLFKRDGKAAFSATNLDAQTAKTEAASIAAELKLSSEQQAKAALHISTLSKSLERMEAGLRQVGRLEAETARLSAELKQTQTTLAQKTTWASESETKLHNLERSHTDLQRNLEAAKAEIARRGDLEIAAREKLFKQSREIETLTSQLGQKTERLSAMSASHQSLQDDLSSQGGEFSAVKNSVLSLQKNVEELSSQLEMKTQEQDAATLEAKNLRQDLSHMKTRYFEANSALDNAKYNTTSQKKVFEETLKRRDNENLALERRIEQLNTQLRVKENMASHFDEEIASLRNTLKSERERHERDAERFQKKTKEVERNARALSRSKAEFEKMSKQYIEATDALEKMQKINAAQARKLERYAALGSKPTATPADAAHEEGLPRLKAVK